MADAVDLLNRNCLIKMVVQTMDQRRESWSNSNTIIFFPDLKKKKEKFENADVLDRYKIQNILQIKQRSCLFLTGC